MKTSFLYFTLMLVLMSFASCTAGIPLSEGPAANNQTYKVDYLFEHDGCKIYRFYDGGQSVYFTTSRSDITAITNDSIKSRVYTISR